MKLTVSQAELNNALQLTGRAVAAKPTHPILANVLLSADAASGTLSITAYDLSLGIQSIIPAAVDSSGTITLPARLLSEIISKLSPDSPLTMAWSPEQEEVEITSLSGSYRVRSQPADDFPDLPSPGDNAPIQLDRDLLLHGLRSTVFASSTDESKQILTGVNLTISPQSLECAATDGHRLSALVQNHSDPGGATTEQSFKTTIPSRSLRELERMLATGTEPIQLFHHNGQIAIISCRQSLTTRSLDGTFPDYRQLVPKAFKNKIRVLRKEFIQSLERTAVLADHHNNVVKISADPSHDKLTILAEAQDVGIGSEQVSASCDGEKITLGFNVKYLIEGLKAISDNMVTLNCNTPTTPVVFTPTEQDEDYLYLVMPIQIRAES